VATGQAISDFILEIVMAKTFGATSTTDEVLEGIDLSGKRVLVTGVSAGLGVETARALAARGAYVIGAARDLKKAERATAQVREDARNGGGLELIELDLASLASVRAAANKLLAEGKPLDIIIANAGVMAAPFSKTVDGFETQLGTNHLGHFVFVNKIAPLLRSGGRFVSLASSGHRMSDVNLEDPNFETTAYDPWLAYGRAKTANVLFAVEFDRRWRDRGVRAVAVHPGGIQTELGRHLDEGAMQMLVDRLNAQAAAAGRERYELKSVPQGAATSVWAAVVADADTIGGRYAEDCGLARVTVDSTGELSAGVRPYAIDPENAKALWAKSEEWVGEKF